MEKTLPINEERVDAVLGELNDPITRNLVLMAVAVARMQFIRATGETESEWRIRLPVADFDMGFFARVVATTFRDTSVIQALLNGSTIEAATGWDV